MTWQSVSLSVCVYMPVVACLNEKHDEHAEMRVCNEDYGQVGGVLTWMGIKDKPTHTHPPAELRHQKVIECCSVIRLEF